MGAILSALTLGFFNNLPWVTALPFGWQLVACAAFGAIAGLVIGLAFRFWDRRVRRQN